MPERPLLTNSGLHRYLGEALIDTGMDTTASLLQMITLMLVAHPEVQRKGQEELDRVLGSDRAPVLDDIHDLPYVQAIIKEASPPLYL